MDKGDLVDISTGPKWSGDSCWFAEKGDDCIFAWEARGGKRSWTVKIAHAYSSLYLCNIRKYMEL